jgi:hypothetical protein
VEVAPAGRGEIEDENAFSLVVPVNSKELAITFKRWFRLTLQMN